MKRLNAARKNAKRNTKDLPNNGLRQARIKRVILNTFLVPNFALRGLELCISSGPIKKAWVKLKWIKYLLQILIITLGLIFSTIGLTHAQGEPTDAELWWDSKTIHHFLVKPSPNASGLFDFFDMLENDPKAETVLKEQLLKKYPSLLRYYQQGLNFKAEYQELVRNRIQDDHHGYHLFFTNYAIQRVLELSETIAIDRTEAPLDFRERERRALGHVSQRYGLASGITTADLRRGILENSGDLSQHYENALLTYDRLMFFYEGEKERKKRIAPLSVDEILDTLSSEIMEARLNNLRATVELAREKRAARNIHLKTLDGNLIPVHEIGTVTQIQETSSGTETHTVFSKGVSYSTDFQRRSWWGFLFGGWTNFSVPNVRENSWVRDFLLPERFKARNNKNSVLIETETDRYVISRSDYEKLLNELRLKGSDNPQAGRKKLIKRFQIEASAREALLADLFTFVVQTRFPDTNTLLTQLEQYQSKLTREQRATGLSLSLISSIEGKESYSSLGFLNGLRWWGYSFHPGNWLRREILAQDQLLPSIFKLKNGMAFKKLDKHQKKALKEEKDQVKKWRATRGLRRWRVYRWIVGVSLLLAPLSPGLIDVSNVWQNEEPAPSLNQNPMHMEESSSEHYIGSEEQKQLQGKVELFKVRDFNFVNWNRTIHIATESNLPRSAIENMDPTNEGDDVVLIAPEPLQTTPEDVFSIETIQYVVPLNGRVGIATPSGFEVSRIRVNEVAKLENESWLNTPLTINEDYKVYRIPTNGLYYLELANPNVEGIKYTVSFEKTDAPAVKIDFEFDPETLRILSLENYKLGAEKVATEIYRYSQGGYRSLSLTQLEGIYSSHSIYTFDYQSDGESQIEPSDLFQGLEQYSKDGYLWYQCTGAAAHLAESFEYAFKRQSAPYQAQQVSGYNYGERYVSSGFIVSGDMAHSQVLVSDKRNDFQYEIFDSTPYERTPPEPEPIELPRAYEQLFTRPEQPREIKESESLAQARINRALHLFDEVTIISQELNELAEKLGPENPIFNNPRELRALPQTKLMAISRVLQEAKKEDITFRKAIFKIYLISQGQFESYNFESDQEWVAAYNEQVEIDGGYQNLIQNILTGINDSMGQLYSGLDKNVDNESIQQIQYLNSSPWRTRHRNLIQILLAVDLNAVFDGELVSMEYSRLTNNRCENLFIESYL